MAVLYFALYLVAFVCFAGSVAAVWRRPERYTWGLVSLGLAAWVFVSVIVSGRALGN
jgi:hypothetical protein